MASIELSENHRRSISITLQLVDQALCEWDDWTNGRENNQGPSVHPARLRRSAPPHGRERGFAARALADSAKIIREFVEDYHEKLEENFLFPRFKKAGKLVDLVDVLLQQHQAGRRLTDITIHLAANQSLKNVDDRRKLADSMRQFIRMYSPHEAREDTVLFPGSHGVVSAHEFDSLGEDFEKKEDELFGDDGFFKVVDRVAVIEKKLGIYELSQFTPKV